jgi:cell division protein ZapB
VAVLLSASGARRLLTAIPPHIYSGGMISDFHDLSEKISQLAALTQSLRSENAELRLRSVALAAENAELARRMQEAHDRVSALLEKIPAPEQDEEAA